MAKLLEPVSPGEVLKTVFMKDFGLSANKLARDIDVPANRITAIVNGRRAITADTALRLGRYFGVEPEFWLNLQTRHDLQRAARAIGAGLRKRIVPIRPAA